MMATNARPDDRARARLLPPEVFFRAALIELLWARRLFRAGLLDGSGMTAAVRLSRGLSRAGLSSWRCRRKHRLG